MLASQAQGGELKVETWVGQVFIKVGFPASTAAAHTATTAKTFTQTFKAGG